MKYCEEVLIEILRKTIKNEKFTDEISDDFDWEELINESKAHNISSLVFYTLGKNILHSINEEILEKWRKQVFLSNMVQIKHISEASNIIKKLNEENIEVIILKGLVLRDLYPRPEFRSMSDADILVRPEDFERAKKCLNECGYTSDNHKNDIHEGFIAPGKLEIEMHYKLINSDFLYIDFSEYENGLWSNSIDAYLNDVQTKTLAKEDFLIHLILHMAVHTKLFGFGIRQIYDFSIFVKENYQQINWYKLGEEVQKYGLFKYTQGVMGVMNELLKVDIPDVFLKDEIRKNDIDLFIENILTAGVHGKKKLNQDFEDLYLTYDYHCDKESVFNKTFRFIFPQRGKMLYLYGSRYQYLEKSKALLPIAWTDRISKEFLKKYGLADTIKEIKYSLEVLKARRNIIKTFKLPD